MDYSLSELMTKAGNHHRYTFFVMFVVFQFWAIGGFMNNTLGFLEAKPKIQRFVDNHWKEETITYEICDKGNYILKKDQVKYSWIIDLNLGCDKFKVSMLGMFNSIGLFLGNILFSPIAKIMGFKTHALVFLILHSLLHLAPLLTNNYYLFVTINFFSEYFYNTTGNTLYVLFIEIIDKNYKNICDSLIFAGLSTGGIYWCLMYYLLKNWRYVFIHISCSSFLTFIIVKIFFFDSLKEAIFAKNKSYFLKNLFLIAKANNKAKELEIALKDNYFKILMDKLFISEGEQLIELQTSSHNEINIKQKDNISSNHDVLSMNNNKHMEITSEDHSNKANNEHKENIIQISRINQNYDYQTTKGLSTKENLPHVISKPSDSKNHKEISKDKGSFIDVLKYPSVRYKFLTVSLCWFCNSALYFGLAIGVKNLHGTIYVNNIILYSCDTIAFFISGFLINSCLGRKKTLQFFTLCYGAFCFVEFIVFNNKKLILTFYFFTRITSMISFCVYYTYPFELYPVKVASTAYGVNAGCNSFAGIIIPWLIEYIPERLVFLIYSIFGILCFILEFSLPETKGVPPRDNIIEIEEQILRTRSVKIMAQNPDPHHIEEIHV